MKIYCMLVGCLLGFNSVAQLTLSGGVKNNATDLSLVGATIQLFPGKHIAVTDEQGQFELRGIPVGDYTIHVRFLGFSNKTIPLVLRKDERLDIRLEEETRWTKEVTVYATRVSDRDPVAFSELGKKAIQQRNIGRDMPYILEQTPSLITTSDAGAGVGYTGIRIRGSDATRVNITINGIPYNDSESHGVFWVNMPDIASSANSIQVQRGVGASTNGAGAFGASINLNTDIDTDTTSVEAINSYGSFNTRRHMLHFAIKPTWDHVSFGGRFSWIKSDGFIDRASSDLASFYTFAKYRGGKTTLQAIIFGGHEVTYQSWYGVPQSRLEHDESAMRTTAMAEGWNAQQLNNLLTSNSRTFNIYTYENQVDDYTQTHYQLHAGHRFNSSFMVNMSLHFTSGKGFFEEFKYDQSFKDYGLSDPIIADSSITKTDLIRRKALDNRFYGVTYSASYHYQKYTGTIGGAWNRYDGDHFGKIIWAKVATTAPKGFQYYFNGGSKYDFTIFWKSEYSITNRILAFLDLQYRRIDYTTGGKRSTKEGLRRFNIDRSYDFFNPKIGITYLTSANSKVYIFYGIANREPVRRDFINAPAGKPPKPETVYDMELGWRIKKAKYTLNVNGYWMNYENQRVLAGELNDVGGSIRTGVPKSYRLGIEIAGTVQLNKRVFWQGNVALSRNKIEQFTEVIYDYGINFDQYEAIKNTFQDTDISFSPTIVSASTLTYTPIKGLELSWSMKYVSDQFLDNTSNRNRKVDAYFVNDLSISYTLKPRFMKAITLRAFLNNVFVEQYESYGYTYGYRGGGSTIRQNYYFPQAGRNYTVMLALKF